MTASQFFKTNTFIAVAAVGALVSPSLTELASRVADGEHVSLFGMGLSQTTYTSTVLPPLFIVWGLSHLERFFRKYLPEVVVQLFTPLLCLVIAVPLTLLIIGPLSNDGAILIADGFNWLVKVAPLLAAATVGGFCQVIVIFGVHWGLPPWSWPTSPRTARTFSRHSRPPRSSPKSAPPSACSSSPAAWR
ncbi:PTS transporter subunit EIIC [Corynebacterium vitaeruminis]|uniref:PTS transporter subunit EIIC n=1 Tax=Corynebacterium vitaeruminis TaxID=38305 RepID=UPI00046D87DD|nr:PTS transporter subunit EIIC [Corynebacterium vitaeruminis]